MKPFDIYGAVRTPRGKANDSGALAKLSHQELIGQQISARAEDYQSLQRARIPVHRSHGHNILDSEECFRPGADANGCGGRNFTVDTV
jgi:acetyl-CoA acetyltransferase